MKKLGWMIAAAVLALGFNTPSDAAPAWKCEKKRCYWTEGYTGSVPDYAANWPAPSQPGCYYVLSSMNKKWRESCPGVDSKAR